MTRQTNRKQLTPISGALNKILRSQNLMDDYRGWTVVTRWSEIVGAEIAKKAKAEKYEAGVLFVTVEDNSWRQELSMRYDEIMEQIRSFEFGSAIKQMRLTGRQKGF